MPGLDWQHVLVGVLLGDDELLMGASTL